jgi:hypothetical protein
MNTSVLIGTLLGDANIYKHKNRDQYTFSFTQSNKDYAVWKATQTGLPFYVYERDRFDKRTGRTYHTVDICLKLDKSNKKNYYNLFYAEKKVVSEEVLCKLTPEAISIWYMDDGSLYYNGNNCHLTLCVDAFSEEEKDLIIQYFKSNYDINFKRSQARIRLTSVKETKKFMRIVQQYVPECMKYKLLEEQIKRHRNHIL